MDFFEKLKACTEQVQKRITIQPEVGIVLGSGLGGLAEEVKDPVIVPYDEIEYFPVSTAPGHQGRFVFGTLKGVPVCVMQGRIHLYEGYDAKDCVLPIRLMGMLGIKSLILTNAAGACNERYHVGDFCVLNDHISSLVPSPLQGENRPELGSRFPDMTAVYDRKYIALIHEAGEKAGAVLHDGVYCQFPGPAYETPAEVKMARILGSDMVGMSTAIEAIAAHHMGIRCCGISLATNMAAGIGDGKLSEEEVIAEGKKASEKFAMMLRILIPKMSRL